MELRPLGETGLCVSRLGLGLAALGRPGYINLGHGADLAGLANRDDLRDHAYSMLDAAWAAGIRYFDVARSYGAGEEFLGTWLQNRGVEPEAVVVGSKWGYTYTANWQISASQHEVKEHSYRAFMRQYPESKAILGRYLKLYQVHSATLTSGLFTDGELLAELARQRDGGLSLGLSLSGVGQGETLARALDLDVGGRPLFAAVQATWNLLETSVGPTLAEAKKRGWGVIIKEALANGRLTKRNRAPDFARRADVLERWALELNTTWDALSLALAMTQPWADVVLSGATTFAQLASNAAAANLVLPAAALHELAELNEAPEVYWETRARLPWN